MFYISRILRSENLKVVEFELSPSILEIGILELNFNIAKNITSLPSYLRKSSKVREKIDKDKFTKLEVQVK